MTPPTDPHNNPPIHPPIGGGVFTNHKSSNRIQLSRWDDIYLFLIISHEPTHWPPIHPIIHYPKVGSVSTNHKSSNRIELSRLDKVLLNFSDFTWFDPLTHPWNQTLIHGWESLHRFQIFKRNRNILIHASLIAFLLIWGGGGMPPGGWLSGWVGVRVGGGNP